MKSLVLLRHGKSSWDDPDLPDHERPLAPRGLRAAREMGRRLKERGYRPDLVLCSTAKRTEATLALVLEELGDPTIQVERERGLYQCDRTILVQRLQDIPEAYGATMVVGHNPELQDATRLLIGAGDPLALAAVREKFPTGAFAMLDFGTIRWLDLAPGAGRLTAFESPKRPERKRKVKDKAKDKAEGPSSDS